MVENVLDVKGASLVTYAVDIVVGGETVFRRDKVAHHYLTRWRSLFIPDTTAGMNHDLGHFVALGRCRVIYLWQPESP